VQAAVTASVDRNRISINDSLVLTLRATEGENVEATDLNALTRDFDVASSGTSTHLSIIQGRTERSTDLQVVLLPRRSGDLRIPALTVDGQRTRAITVQVSEAPDGLDSSRDVFVESEVDKNSVYVQSQLIHTFRVYEAIDLTDRGRSELKIDDAVIEELDSTSFQRIVDGRPYRVIELKHAIFPQKSGELVIPSISFNGRKQTGRRSFLSLGGGEQVRARSAPITVTVKPVPAAYPDAPWVPASKLRLEESWSTLPEELEVGDSVTRTLTLIAEGIDGSQLPQIEPMDIDGIKAYPDQPRSENRRGAGGITGLGINSTALLLTRAGEFTLPGVRVPWWDTDSESLRYTELPARQISVAEAAGMSAETPVPPPVATATSVEPAAPTAAASLWMWATLAALIGWMGTTVWLTWRLRAPAAPRRGRNTHDAEADLFKACLAACNANEAPAARAALQTWARAFFEERSLPSLQTIAERLRSAELDAALETLERKLYAEHTDDWRGDELALALKACRKRARRSSLPQAEALPPLYGSGL
jgi:hypothetical protein